MDHRQIARTLAAGRVAIGASMVLVPGLALRPWVGEGAGRPDTKVIGRALGVRDLALGAGVLRALERGEPARGWVLMSALSDGVDLAATVLAVRRLGLRRALPVMIVAGTAAVAGALAADQLD